MARSAQDLIARIDRELPQTQCTRCGYPACRDYAQAIAEGAADIDRCPPGGADGIARLAALLGRAQKPLDPACGVEKPAEAALIDEAHCIGCTKCIQVCPVDAILGANKFMHTVLADECSGCELCIPACPVDCIALVASADATPVMARATQYRRRHQARTARLERERTRHEAAIAERKARLRDTSARDAVLDAVARAKAKRAAQP